MSRTTPLSSASNRSTKLLTDFSIETIIGQSQVQAETRGGETTTTTTLTTATRQNDTPQLAANRKYRAKNFVCPACKMAFSNNGQLKNHVRIHTGERPFRCNHGDCNKTFTRNEELTRHKLIHSGVRPHICTTCGKRFGRKDHLKKHARTHDRKKFRRRLFVPTVNSACIQDSTYVSPKQPIKIESVTRSLESDLSIAKTMALVPSTNSLATYSAQPIPALTLTPPHYQTATATPSTTNTTTAIAAAATTFQQLAADYWNKWYSLLGYCHQQHCPPAERLTSFFRQT